ncbi:MAG: AAA family ATPase [Candidatus Dormibacteria bacterium]
MKLAVTGKGGTGKTTVTAILARQLARSGVEVVAIDADPNPNLGISLGMGVEAAMKLDGIVNVLLREKAALHNAHHHDHADDDGHSHAEGENACEPPSDRSTEQLLEEMSVMAPDGVRLVQTGKLERPSEGCLCCGSHSTTRRLFSELPHAGRMVIADLEAGVNDLLWARPGADDAVLVVTEPYRKSLEVARRALQVALELGVKRAMVLANRVQSEEDLQVVVDFLSGVDVEILAIPEDEVIAAADRNGRSPLDNGTDSPGVAAIVALARTMEGVG